MDAHETYEGFIRLEDRSAEMYLELSVRWVDNPALRWFWVAMAMEEKQHAGMLQHCWEFGVFAGELPSREQFERLEALCSRLEKEIANPDLTLDDAFDLAIRLESSEINDVYSKLTAPIEGPAHVMRKKMELSVASHFEKLRSAARKFGVSAEVQARMTRLLTPDGSPHDAPR